MAWLRRLLRWLLRRRPEVQVVEPESRKYTEFSETMRCHLLANDRERKKLAACEFEIRAVDAVAQAANGMVTSVYPYANSVSVYAATPTFREGLPVLLKAFARRGWRIKKRNGQSDSGTISLILGHPHSERTIDLTVSSSSCKRVKVGVRTEKVDIYKTVCE